MKECHLKIEISPLSNMIQVHVDHGLLHPDVGPLGDEEEDPAARRHLEDHLALHQALRPRFLLRKQRFVLCSLVR